METLSVKGRICYRSHCKSCGADRGFIPKSRLDKECKTCSNGKKMLGKVSPRKGVKTNKLAWNSGLTFSKLSKEQKKIKHSIKTGISIRLKSRGGSKSGLSTFNILGFSLKDLMNHLESKFETSMSWDNYGKWHIDHVTPDSWFAYSSINDEDFKKSWALDNLQPMWAKDNLKKYNKFSGSYNA